MSGDIFFSIVIVASVILWLYFKESNPKVAKKVTRIFESDDHKLLSIPFSKLTGRPSNFQLLDYDKKYKIMHQMVYGHPEYGFGDLDPEDQRYIICFSTDKHLNHLKEHFGENFRIEFIDDPLNQLLSFEFKVNLIQNYHWMYFTHIIVKREALELYVNKEDYENYISKKIPRNVAHPNSYG